MELRVPTGVFAPISDSWMLADAVRREPMCRRGTVLDIGTGSGVVALAAADVGGTVTAVDVSRAALDTTLLNARRAGLVVTVRHGSLFEPVGDEAFDVITSNPPYVPRMSDELPGTGPSRAWAGGRSGRLLVDAICDGALARLRPGGALLMVHSSLVGDGDTVARLGDNGFARVEVIERRRGPLGPLMRAQQRLGVLPADIDEEELVTIRATTDS